MLLQGWATTITLDLPGERAGTKQEAVTFCSRDGGARLQLLFATKEGGRGRGREDAGRAWDPGEERAESGKEGRKEMLRDLQLIINGPHRRGNAVWPGEPHMLGGCSQKKNKLERTPKGKLNDAHQCHFGPEP